MPPVPHVLCGQLVKGRSHRLDSLPAYAVSRLALLTGRGAADKGPLAGQAVKLEETNVVGVRDWFGFAQDQVPLLTKRHFGREQFASFSGRGQSFPLLPLGP